MSRIVVSQQQATHPGLLPHRCLRCNAPAADVVPRPVGLPPAAGNPSVRFPRDGPGLLLGALVLLGLGVSQFRTSRSGIDRALGLFVVLVGLGTVGAAAAALGGVKLPRAPAIALVLCLFASILIIVLKGRGPRDLGDVRAFIPVCERHRNHWRSYQRTVLAFALGSVLYLVGLIAGNPLDARSRSADWLVIGLLGLIGLIALAAFFVRAPLTATRTAENEITIRGVSAAYAREMPAREACGEDVRRTPDL